jgi:hypothetical protein
MIKPIGYYTDVTSYLEEMQIAYGSRFELMTKREKLFLITAIAAHLNCLESGVMRSEMFTIRTQVNALPIHEQEGLLEALIAQIRWGQNAETVHHA